MTSPAGPPSGASVLLDSYSERLKQLENITRETVNKVLNDIVTVLERQDDASIHLWYILTALRGPDMVSPLDSGLPTHEHNTVVFQVMQEKQKSTSRLRGALGLVTSGYFSAEQGRLEIPDSAIVGDHFAQHFKSAMNSMRFLGRIS